jgi:L-alanine-DL-glutamate epimerase-like enolase superfamily enzyme
MPFDQKIAIAEVALYPLRAAGGVSPQMALGTMPTRPALLIRISDTDGCHGWGEVWANFPPRANTHKAHVIEDVFIPELQGMSFTDPSEVATMLRRKLTLYFLHVGQLVVFEHLLAGLDIALWDLALRKAGKTFTGFFGIDSRTVATYASSINDVDLESLIPHHASLGQRQFKLKIGFQPDGGKALLQKAASLCPGDAQLMVDCNQSWSPAQAQRLLPELESFEPVLVEEPIPASAAIDDWSAVSRATRIPLAAGENVYGVESFIALGNAGVTYLQPDVAKWGGISGALQLAENLPAGTRLWPHFMGTAVGQYAALSLTLYAGADSICELDVNPNPLRTELCGDALSIEDGNITLTHDCGLVCEPHATALAAFNR